LVRAFPNVIQLEALAARLREPEAREQTPHSGVALVACRNSTEAQKLALDDLLPGFTVAQEGAVVRLAELRARRLGLSTAVRRRLRRVG